MYETNSHLGKMLVSRGSLWSDRFSLCDMGRRVSVLITSCVAGMSVMAFVAQILSLFLVGSTHHFALVYVSCTVCLCIVSFVSIGVALKKDSAGVLVSSWGGMICTIVMVLVYLYYLDGKEFPFVLILLPFGALGLGTVCGYKCSIAYTSVGVSVCVVVGILTGVISQAMGVCIALIGALFLSMMFNSLLCGQMELETESKMFREWLETIIDAKRDEQSGRTEDTVSECALSDDR